MNTNILPSPSKTNSSKDFKDVIAFTLAEVLTVLAILGTVAAMIIPSAMSNFRKAQTISRLKIAYSIFSRAAEESVATYGPISTWPLNKTTGGFTTEYYNSIINNYKTYAETYFPFNVAYTCKYGDDSTKCFYSNGEHKNAFFIQGKNGIEVPTNWNTPKTAYMARLKNGMSVAVSGQDPNSSSANGSARPIFISFDIDGPFRGKSVIGKDVFVFWITPFDNMYTRTGQPYIGPFHKTGEYSGAGRNLIPNDGYDDFCGKGNRTSNGAYLTGGGHVGCANVIIKSGWKIPDGYPFKF